MAVQVFTPPACKSSARDSDQSKKIYAMFYVRVVDSSRPYHSLFLALFKRAHACTSAVTTGFLQIMRDPALMLALPGMACPLAMREAIPSPPPTSLLLHHANTTAVYAPLGDP